MHQLEYMKSNHNLSTDSGYPSTPGTCLYEPECAKQLQHELVGRKLRQNCRAGK